MKYIFVGFEDNWADEIDVNINTAVKMSEEDFEELFKKIDIIKRKHRTKTWYYIGTNEAIEYETGVEFIDALDIREMTEKEYKVFEKFGIIGEEEIIFSCVDDLYEKCKDLEDAIDEKEDFYG